VRVAFDTNILAYAEGVNDRSRHDIAKSLVQTIRDEVIIPVQALGELFTVLTRKAKWPAEAARASVLSWRDAFEVAPTTADVLLEAMELVASHEFSFWDAVMVSAAAQAGCRILISEDMQSGFTWRGLTLRNPFP